MGEYFEDTACSVGWQRPTCIVGKGGNSYETLEKLIEDVIQLMILWFTICRAVELFIQEASKLAFSEVSLTVWQAIYSLGGVLTILSQGNEKLL